MAGRSLNGDTADVGPSTGSGPPPACDACLRRGALVGRVAPGIARLLSRGRRRPTGLFELSDEDLARAVGGADADRAMARFEREFDPSRARAELAQAGIDCVCRHSEKYPSGLRQLADAPAALYVAGGLRRLGELLGEPAVTVVGSREATPYAIEVAETLGRGLSAAGITVVSGLALGVDAAAHRGVMSRGECAIAVLACGVDVAYPPSHRRLYERIRSGGAVISELPPGTPPMRWSFPARNRLMAALGELTVVVEAKDGSGSLITATFAEQLGRDVGAVPGRVTGARASGSNRLLRDGARVIRGPQDVLDELFGARPAAGSGDLGRRRERTALATRPSGRAGELEPRARRVLEAVDAGHGIDAISQAAGLTAGEVRAALGRLELVGLVARDGLGTYERTAVEP